MTELETVKKKRKEKKEKSVLREFKGKDEVFEAVKHLRFFTLNCVISVRWRMQANLLDSERFTFKAAAQWKLLLCQHGFFVHQ